MRGIVALHCITSWRVIRTHGAVRTELNLHIAMLRSASAFVKFVHFKVIILRFVLWIGTRNHFQYRTETHIFVHTWYEGRATAVILSSYILKSSLRQHKREADWITYYLSFDCIIPNNHNATWPQTWNVQ
jgi:hypothetical protein